MPAHMRLWPYLPAVPCDRHDDCVIIDGLLVPELLVEAEAQGRWVAPVPSAPAYQEVFRDEAVQPVFLPSARMRANYRWIEAMPEEYRKYYLGKPHESRPPGDVDPYRSLLIGDLGPDQPIALDYRRSMREPTVIYLGTVWDWLEIAPDVGTFLARMKL